MAYIDKNLIAGETIVFRTGLHWMVLVVPGLVGTAFLLLGVAFVIGSNKGETSTAILTGTVMAIFGVLILAMSVVRRNATEMAVTNKRVILKDGVLRNRTIELFLSKVESIGVEQGLLGRMFGYGDIVVRGTGGTAEPFRRVRTPLEFRREVQRLSEEPI